MCGIVGYVGKERCVEVLMDGLKHLEYRGYDSAGLALQVSGRIEVIKQAGHLNKLAEAVVEHNGNLSRVRAGVGHTRWATHGRPNEVNAHPQVGNGGTVAVVHNGIIENFAELKEELEGRGVAFESETDTEVIAHLLAEGMEEGGSLREALAKALRRLRGSFAVAAVDASEPEKIVAARHQSPLVLAWERARIFWRARFRLCLSRPAGFSSWRTGRSWRLRTPQYGSSLWTASQFNERASRWTGTPGLSSSACLRTTCSRRSTSNLPPCGQPSPDASTLGAPWISRR